MIVVIGGKYQGKLGYIKEMHSIDDCDIQRCDDQCSELDFSKNVIYGYGDLVYRQLKNAVDPLEYLQSNIDKLKGKIIISDDIFCGVVPCDESEGKWREELGRCMIFLSKRASEVHRVFCGLGMRVK